MCPCLLMLPLKKQQTRFEKQRLRTENLGKPRRLLRLALNVIYFVELLYSVPLPIAPTQHNA